MMNTPATLKSHAPQPSPANDRYARVITASKRARWDLETDVLKGRRFDPSHTFLPDGLSLVSKLGFLSTEERRFASQVQGRTYANMFGFIERLVNAKVLQLAQSHVFGDQSALEALVRFSDEELKHQELFRRLEVLAAEVLPAGYRFVLDADDVAKAVIGKPNWAVLALICLIELFSQAHYKESIASEPGLSELFTDVFRFHWMEESQHAVVDELEWVAENARLDDEERDRAVTALIELVGAVDGLLRTQAPVDARYFVDNAGRVFSGTEAAAIEALFLEAYRYQYIFSGLKLTRFPQILGEMIDAAQSARIDAALASLASLA